MLFVIKLLHTLIWGVMAGIVLFVLWSGLSGTITEYSWAAALIVACEGVVLLLFKGSCPLTLIARKHSSSLRSNFDIFLPEWLAKYNKLIFGTLYITGFILMVLKYYFREV